MFPRTHHPAPDFTLPDLQGKFHALSHYRGQIVILNFWSAECPWVERTDQALSEALQEWAAISEAHAPVVLLPVASNANETPEQLTQISGERGIPFVLHDPNRRVADLYQAETTPHLFVIDSNGILRYQGAFDDVTFRQRTPTRHYLKDAVDALLRGDTPDPCKTPAYGCSIVPFAE